MKQIRINGDENVTVNTDADTKLVKEVIKTTLKQVDTLVCVT